MFGFAIMAPDDPRNAAGQSLDLATSALIARMEIAPTASRRVIIDALIRALKAAGIWAKLDLLQVLAAHDSQAALLNWKGTDFTAVNNGAAFITDKGFHTDGLSQYVNWAFAPANGVNFTQNSAAFGAWTRKVQADHVAGSLDFGTGTGALGSAPCIFNTRNRTDNTVFRLNGTTSGTGTDLLTSGAGLAMIDRAGASSVRVFRGGQPTNPVSAAASASRSAISINSGRVADAFGENQFCAHIAGSALTAAEHIELHAALAGYMDAIGLEDLAVISASTRSIMFATVLPDGGSGADAGKGWTCTGLAPLPDGTWLVGNDGRKQQGDSSPFASSIVHVSADMSSILHQWTSAALGLAAASIQGVAWEALGTGGLRGNIYFLLIDTPSKLYRLPISSDWSAGMPVLLASITGANGLAYDSITDRLLVLVPDAADTSVLCYSKSGANLSATVAPFYPDLGSSADQLFFDLTNGDVWITEGANNISGAAHRYTRSGYGGYYRAQTVTLSGADAIEGFAILSDGNMIVMNDAYFHGGTPALNRILRYSSA